MTNGVALEVTQIDRTFTLTLDEETARTLHDLTGEVCGGPLTYGKYTDQIYNQLHAYFRNTGADRFDGSIHGKELA